MSSPEFKILQDGTIDIAIGEVVFTGICPYVNEKPVITSAVVLYEDSSVRYEAPQGSITLALRAEADEVVLSTVIEGWDHVHDIDPIGAAETNAEHIYMQGYGMEGPSGYYAADSTLRISHGIAGLDACTSLNGRQAIADQGTGTSACAVFTTDHRRFAAEFSLQEAEGKHRTHRTFTAGFNLECTASGWTELPDIHFAGGETI